MRGAVTNHTPPGDPIYVAGRVPPVLAILRGSARVVMHTQQGRELTIRHASAGDVLGLVPQLTGAVSTSAHAETEATTVELPLARLQEVAAQHPELAWAIAGEIARWSTEAFGAATEAAGRPVSERLAEHLLELSASSPPGRMHAHVTHKGLAGSVGTAREVVTRTLAELRQEGVVDTRPGVVIVLDAARLEAIARR